MDRKAIKNLIETVTDMDFSNPATKPIVLGLIETLYEMIIKLEGRVQDLEDEIKRLKGEKGKPDIKPNRQNNSKQKMEQEPNKLWMKKAKAIKIDREIIVPINRDILPNDVVFKGYTEKVIQNIKITTDNVLYKRETFYSSIENKTYIAHVPFHLEGTSFGPELKAWIMTMYFENRMTENLIHAFLSSVGIFISEGEISNIIIKEKAEKFTMEKDDIFETGVSVSNNIGIDDSGFKEDGQNKYINIICNALFASFVVNDRKNSQTIEKMFEKFNLENKVLSCDDAPQWFILVTLFQLCWVHEERHYKKLNPILKSHREELTKKISEIWDYYKMLKDYKEHPNNSEKKILVNLFDDIFNVESIYPALNERLKLTYAKKNKLLTVLDNPGVAIHNNMSENGIRPSVIKRKISNGTRVKCGTIAWENHLSILITCKKHKISYFEYVLDIFKGQEHKSSLSSIIRQKALV